MKVISAYVFKPKRDLFYINATKTEIDDYFKGIVPKRLAELNGEFGTYDIPGVYLVNKDGKSIKVIGIEYRPEDDRINYPKDLECVHLKKGYVISDTIFDDDDIDDEWVSEYINNGGIKTTVNPFNGATISPSVNPEVIQFQMDKGQNRIIISAEYITKDKTEMSFEEDKALDINSDVSKEAEANIEIENTAEYMATHDPVTGHHNWNYIWPILTDFGNYGIQDFAFVHFDVKDFKAINIVYGHAVANLHLRRIVEKLKNCDWIYYSARCDNDNFAMMIKDMPQDEMLQKLEDFFNDISFIDIDKNYRIYYRCGVVPMRSTLLLGNRVADAAKQAQRSGSKLFESEIIVFTDKMRVDQEWSTNIRAYLNTAIEKDEFMIYLQPKYDIQTNKLHGAEALIRWNYKGKEILTPGKFVPIFETGGLISKLDDIVLHKVCRFIKSREESGKELFPISVNVSRKSVGITGLVEHLTRIVDSYGIRHDLIDFELTESAAYDNQEYMLRVLHELRNNGFRISMDDFGTGFSTLSLLTMMPIDTIKIDKSFVDSIGVTEECRDSCTIIKHIISMAKEMRLTCLAEGAEEREQINLLKEFGCKVVQGYFFSKPLPLDEFEDKVDA